MVILSFFPSFTFWVRHLGGFLLFLGLTVAGSMDAIDEVRDAVVPGLSRFATTPLSSL